MVSISQLQRDIISNRLPTELRTPEIIEQYFINKLNLDQDLDKIKDINKAALLIDNTINRNGHIVIISDRDADGINSAAVLYLGLTKIFNIREEDVKVIINPRKEENGVSNYCMNKLWEIDAKRQVDLIIISDHGSTNENEYKKIKEEKPYINILLTDHHTVQYDIYPNSADVFINPQREDNEVFKYISGCQVALLTLVAAYKHMFKPDNFNMFNILLPYAGLTVISDVMPLNNIYNRYMIKTGLQVMNKFDNPVWLAIKKLLDIPGCITYRDIAFRIAALINTANRTHHEELGFKFLTAKTLEEALELGKQLSELNNIRIKVTKEITKEVMRNIDLIEYDSSIVTIIDTDLAINGLIAASLGNKYHLPAICFTEMEDKLQGSCRANVNGFDILSILQKLDAEHPNIIKKLGGHHGACGCSIDKDKLKEFSTLFNNYSKEELSNIKQEEELLIDASIPEKDITPMLGTIVESCGPYGKDWREPLFYSELSIYRTIIKGPYLDIHFTNGINGGCFLDSLDINLEDLTKDKKVKVIYTPLISNVKGVFKFELSISKIELL